LVAQPVAVAISVGVAATFVGAGDIASCEGGGDEETAALLDQIVEENPDAVVFTLGDNVYPRGSREAYRDCYGPSWGRHRDRTRPGISHLDYRGFDTRGYFDYFSDRAGEEEDQADR